MIYGQEKTFMALKHRVRTEARNFCIVSKDWNEEILTVLHLG